MQAQEIFNKLKINLDLSENNSLIVNSPINGEIIAKLKYDEEVHYNRKIAILKQEFEKWRDVPAPKRGELIRLFAEKLRQNKELLAELITLEAGKIISESRGEVQEMIDICDFAVGLSRQLYGLTIASERANHNMYETYYPLGIVGVISAFNFPMAVWAWNFALAIICGNGVIWKPSEKTPLCAIASNQLFQETAEEFEGYNKAGLLSQIIISDARLGEIMVNDPRVNLISATGSCAMGRNVAPIISKRFGKMILELGGNNAAIVSNQANLDLAIDSIVFGAVGTAGQRCTTTRRVFAHQDIYEELIERLKFAYQKIAENKIGNPLEEDKLLGPLISEDSFAKMKKALKLAKKQGAEIFMGERALEKEFPNAYYVNPALVMSDKQIPIILEETFAPILYVMPYNDLAMAMIDHNAVEQGLSSTIFTNDLREAEFFRKYSDCGIANVNIGTSGAEIGGAFGGEKATGGGRESGSDAWKNYMRRQTSTVYYGSEKPKLAQNVNFDL